MTETGRPQPAAAYRCKVAVAGPLGAAATRALRAQYGSALGIDRGAEETVLDLDGLDQAAIRGVLILLWDLGHDVMSVTNRTKEQSP